MAPVRLDITVHGEKIVQRQLGRLASRALHAKPAFVQIGLQMLDYELALFNSQGASGGDRWKPISETTRAAKAAHTPPLDPRVLHATRRLRRSLTQRGNPDQLRRSHDDRLEFGSRVPYAQFHQSGTSRMPRRPPTQLTELQKRYLVKVLQTYIVRSSS